MDNKGDISHKGLIKRISEKEIVVCIESQSACASCHAKGACSVADVKEKEISVTSWEGQYSVGEQVVVIARESQGFTALFFAYIITLLLLILSLIVFLEFLEEGLAALLSLGLLVPYYAGLYVFRRHLRKALQFTIRKT